MMLSILVILISYNAIGQPSKTTHYVYVGQGSFSTNLGKSGTTQVSRGSYLSGQIFRDCSGPGPGGEIISDNTSSISCGTYTRTWSSQTNTIVPSSSNGAKQTFSYRVTYPSHTEANQFQAGENCFGNNSIISTNYSGNCNRSVPGGVFNSGTDLEVFTYSFDNKINSINVCNSDGPINLNSTTYWTRTSLPRSYGNISFSGSGVTGSTFNPSGLNGSYTVIASLPFWNGTATASFVINVTAGFVNAGSNQAVCEDSGNIPLTSPTSGVSWSCVGCSYVSSGQFNSTAAPPGNYTVRASKTVSGCVGADDKTFTVYGNPTVQAGSNYTVCVNDNAFALTGESPTHGVYTSNCGSCLAGNQFNPLNAGSGVHTITYTYTNSNGCTESDTRTVTVIGLPSANSITTNRPDRCGAGNVDFTASLPGHTIHWYTASSGGTVFHIGNSLSAQSIPVGVTTYYLEAENSNGCFSSSRKAISGEAYASVPNPTAVHGSSCGPGSVSLGATGSGGVSYRWYENSSGGSVISIGATFQTPVLNSTRDYYVEAFSGDNCLSGRTQVTATINTVPGEPTPFDGSHCGPGVVNLSVGGAPAGGSYRWYLTETSETSFNSTSSWTENFSTTTTYWVSIVNPNGCESPREPVLAEVLQFPPAPNGVDAERCGPGTVTISATHGQAGTFNWYETFTSNVSIAIGTNFTTPSISSTRTYWVEFTDQNGCISPRSTVTASILDVISDPTVPNVERCGPGEVTINTFSPTQGAIFSWYNTVTGGDPIFVGESFTTTETARRNYYVGASSPEGCNSLNRTPVTVTINPIPGIPLVNDGDICGSGEITLTALGAPAGGDYNWYQTNTSSTVISNGSEFTTPSITASRSYYVSIVNQQGCEGDRREVLANVNAFPSPPVGTDGDRCGTGNVDLRATTTTPGASINWYLASSGGSPFASGEDTTIDDLEETTTYYAATVSTEGCESTRIQVVATINPIQQADIGEDIQLCLNAGPYNLAADLVDVDISNGFFVGDGVIGTEIHPNIAGLGNKEITFVLEDEVGCLLNGTRFITVVDIIDGGTALNLSESEINQCINGGSLDLNELPNVPGGSWVITADDESLNVGIFNPEVAGVGEYTATYSVDINGCTVQESVDINVTAAPSTPTIAGPTSVCINEAVTLSIDNPGEISDTYSWYKNNEITSFASGESVEVEIDEYVTYSVQVQNVFGCLSEISILNIEAVEIIVEFFGSPTINNEGDRVEFLTNVEGPGYQYLWDFGDGLTSTQQNPSHLYFTEGSYDVTLTITDAQGCIGTLTEEDYVTVNKPNEVVTSIDDLISFEEPKVYPQPFVHSFSVDIKSISRQDVKAYIFGLDRAVLYERSINLSGGDNSITFENLDLPSGVYMMRIMDSEGTSFDQKIIKIE